MERVRSGDMRKYKISDICKLEKGRQIDTSLLSIDNKYKYMNGGIAESGYYTDFNTVGHVVTVSEGGASCGFVNYMEEPFWCGCHCYRLTDINFPSKYIYYALKANQENIMALRTGSAMPNIKKSSFAEFEISLSENTEEQKQVVRKLEHIDHLICSRQVQCELCDQLVKSRFVAMFSSKDYETVCASEVCDFITKGTTPPTGEIHEHFKDGDIPYLKVYNLSFTGALLFDQEPQFVSSKIHNGLLARSKVFPNDVLMNIVGPPLGKFSLVTYDYPEWNINQAIAIFRAKEGINPRYLMAALMQPETLRPFLSQAVGIRQLNLSLEQCRNLKIQLPPLELQEQFAAFVQATDKSKLAIQQSLDELELLKKSLMQKYFG